LVDGKIRVIPNPVDLETHQPAGGTGIQLVQFSLVSARWAISSAKASGSSWKPLLAFRIWMCA
jgi:hypothetical protein